MTTTNLSRRKFFGLLAGTAATHFLPPIGGWKSDVIIKPPDATVFLIGGPALPWPDASPFPITLKMLQDAYAQSMDHPQYLYWSKNAKENWGVAYQGTTPHMVMPRETVSPV